MQSCSVQSLAYALAKTPLLVDRACAFFACKSRVCAFARGFSESCSDSLMLSPVLFFFFFFLRVLMQLTMCRSGFSLSLSRLSLPLALLYGLICGSCTCFRLFPELEYLRRFAVVLWHLFFCDGDSLRFIPNIKRSRFFLSFFQKLVTEASGGFWSSRCREHFLCEVSSHGSKDRNKCSVVRESVSCLLRCCYGRGRTTTTSGTWPALKLSLKWFVKSCGFGMQEDFASRCWCHHVLMSPDVTPRV